MTSSLLLAVASTSAPALAQVGKAPPTNSNGTILGNPQNAIDDLNGIFKILTVYKNDHGGKLPDDILPLFGLLLLDSKKYGFDSYDQAHEAFINPDSKFAHPDYPDNLLQRTVAYKLNAKRSDGTPVDGNTPPGTRDLLAWTNVYVYPNIPLNPGATFNPVGFYMVLWSDGTVEKVPLDEALFAKNADGSERILFQGQFDPAFDAASYADKQGDEAAAIGKPFANGQLTPDNGGPEALLQLSRRLALPGTYGIERETLWQAFDPSYGPFKLADLQTVTALLGLQTKVSQLSLAQLQQSGTAALLALNNNANGRLVALLALDADRAVIVDRGVTNNIPRTQLETNYSGEALVPDKSLTQKAALVADDPVRTIAMPAANAEIRQQVTLHNTGKTPITLQLEYPLAGITEAKLSQSTLAPGESATLDLKMKWRSGVNAPRQNVFVSLRTSDPIVPRLQLAFQLLAAR